MNIYTAIFDHWTEPATLATSFRDSNRAVEHVRTFFLSNYYPDFLDAFCERDLQVGAPEHKALMLNLAAIKEGPVGFDIIEETISMINALMGWSGSIGLFESELIE